MLQVKVPLEAGDVIVRTAEEGTSWESPRSPFEVEVECKARIPSSSGQQGSGSPFFATAPDHPLRWAIGDSSCPPGERLRRLSGDAKMSGLTEQLFPELKVGPCLAFVVCLIYH